MALLQESLNSLQAGFSVVRGGETNVAPGQRVNAKLLAPSDLSAFEVVDLPINNLTLGTLGALTGSLPFPLKVPVGFSVKWNLQRGSAAAVEGTDFFAPDGLTSPDVSLVFPPIPAVVEEFTDSQPLLAPPTSFSLRANVKLSVGGSSPSFDVPPPPAPGVPIPVVRLRVPTMLVLFRHKNFAPQEGSLPGFALICVPKNSPLKDSAAVINTLNTLKTAVAAVSSFLPPKFANFLRGIPVLATALAGVPNVLLTTFDDKGEIQDLNKLTIIDKRGPALTDIEPSNNASSLIFMGPSKQMDCFVRANLNGEKLGIRTNSSIEDVLVVIRNLHTERPESETGGSVGHHGPNYGDNIRSLKLSQATAGFANAQASSSKFGNARASS